MLPQVGESAKGVKVEKVDQEQAIDYEAAITAAQSLHGYRQGTGACVAFAKGAEWQAKQASAAPQVAQPQQLTDEQVAALNPWRGTDRESTWAVGFRTAERACAEKWGVKLASQEGGAA